MQFLFETSYVSVEFPLTLYKIFVEEPGCYFANPVNAWPRYLNNQPPEFYFTKTNGKWVSDIHVRADILEELGKDVEGFISR